MKASEKYIANAEIVQSQNNGILLSPFVREGGDQTDSPPIVVRFTWFDFFLNVVSIIFFVADILTDGVLAYFYYSEGFLHYFGLTICFTVIPSFTVNFISFKWYWSDRNSDYRLNLTKGEWTSVVILHILQLGPVMRYYMTIKYGRLSVTTSEEKRRYFKTMLWETTDVCLLRLIEAFMESAPQLVLQLYILARNSQMIRWHYETAFIAGVPHNFIPIGIHDASLDNSKDTLQEASVHDPFLGTGPKTTVLFQIASILTSLISLAWALTSYSRNARFVLEKKKNLSFISTFCHYMWHLWAIAARVLALALFASIFSFWVGVGCLLRWLVMFIWLMRLKKNFCDDKCLLDALFKGIIAFVYLFSFLNVIDEPTKYKYIFFYCYDVLENVLYISLWYAYGDPHTWFYHLALAAYWACTLLGFLFMYLYYNVFHPVKEFHILCCDKIEDDKRSSNLTRSSSRKEPHRTVCEELDWVSKVDVT